MSKLIVYYQDKVVGQLTFDQEERLGFQYDDGWITFTDRFPLSLALPLEQKVHGHLETKSFFENLLPEGEIRNLLEAHGKSSIKSEFGFLQEFGGDCAGAFKILPEKVSASKTKTFRKELKLDTIYKYLVEKKSLTDVILNKEGGKFSLAGAQDKFAVFLENNSIYLPLDGSPTTHIIKPHVRYFNSTHDSPYNEYFCMKLAEAVGLIVPKVEIIEGDYPLFIIERFDRIKGSKMVNRIHQQDFCQAQGVTSLKKYESDGGPSFKANYNLVKDNSISPIKDLNQLLKWLIFNLVIGNNDSHSKNLAFIQRDEGLRLAPFYDLLSTSIYKELKDQKFSFSIGGQTEWHKLKSKHFDLLSKELGLKPDFFSKVSSKLLKDLDEAIADQLTAFNERFSEVDTANIIGKEVFKRANYFKKVFTPQI